MGTWAQGAVAEATTVTHLLHIRGEGDGRGISFPHLMIPVVSASSCHCPCPSQRRILLDSVSLIVTFFCSQHSAKSLWMTAVRLVNKCVGCGNLCSSLGTKAALPFVPELGRQELMSFLFTPNLSKTTLGQQKTFSSFRVFPKGHVTSEASLVFSLFLCRIEA